MVFLFGMNRPKNAGDLCRSTKAVLLKVLAEEKVPAPLEEEVARYLEEMKAILQGTRGIIVPHVCSSGLVADPEAIFREAASPATDIPTNMLHDRGRPFLYAGSQHPSSRF